MSNKNKEVDFDYSVCYDYYDSKEYDKAKRQAKKGSVGKPHYIPNKRDYDIIRALSIFGASHDYISRYIGITAKTLRKYYPELLKECKDDKNTAAESALFVQVMKGNIKAIMYWLDNHCRDKYNIKVHSNETNIDYDSLLKVIADKLPD